MEYTHSYVNMEFTHPPVIDIDLGTPPPENAEH